MLTPRGLWFFLTVFLLLAAATLIGATPLMIVCLTLLFWFLSQWFLFQWRLRRSFPALRASRVLRTARGEVHTIWAGQIVEVVVELTGRIRLPFVIAQDRLPASAQMKDGTHRIDGPLVPLRPLVMRYRLECRSPGRLRFEGVKIQLADLQGFFTYSGFLREPKEYRVLPTLAVEASHSTFVKQHNVLPLLGTHRHLRPGTGSELLELRDYISGDPPKTIAWKVSARRDRLITREFESEVPLRCTLFLDVSSSVRLGRVGETALCRLVAIAAGIAQANSSERDLTGVCLFDEKEVLERIAPGRGARHFLKLLDVLTRAAGLMPRPAQVKLRALLPLAQGLVQELYPDWLSRDVNYFPPWLPWWAPQPFSTIAQPPLPAGKWWQRPWLRLRRRLHLFFFRRRYRPWRFSLTYQREYRWRKQVSAVLAVHYRLGPGGLALLLEDDQLCAEYMQRFLAEHQVAYPYPLHDEAGNDLFAAPHKADVLARALLQAITRGRDNELFVLCVELRDGAEQLGVLQRAICLARAKHHQVVVICPSAAGFAEMRQAFARLGVPVVSAAQKNTVGWTLHHMRRLRIQERGVL